MGLYFKNEECKEETVGRENVNYKNNRTAADAFLLLLKDIKKEDLSNLCVLIQEHFKNNYGLDLSEEDAYNITQMQTLKSKYKKEILELAYRCIESDQHLGNNTILDGKVNTSSWISHSLFVGKLCRQLAKFKGLDPETAEKIGIIHDYGRKYTHTFEHTMRGYEELMALGYEDESIACLTHSFIGGNRCANNDPAEEGFYVDDSGNPKWDETAIKDDMTLFLENYNYNEYDDILTIADLMATDRGIVSPLERIKDIETRKKPDPRNRAYFIAEFTNKLKSFMSRNQNTQIKNCEIIRATKNISLEEIMKVFEKVSSEFFSRYKKRFIGPNYVFE